MPQLTHAQYDRLERAITDGTRIIVWRRGTEYVVIPERLRVHEGRERIEARNPTTGDRLAIYVDEMDRFEPV